MNTLNVPANNLININTNQSILPPSAICVSGNSDHHIINIKPGETVYDSNGNVIGILDESMNVISNNGTLNIMRPITPIQLSNLPPSIEISKQHKSDAKSETNLHSNNFNHVVSDINHQSGLKQQKTITPATMKRGRHIPSSQKPFVCKICGKGYKYLCNYRSHCKIHTSSAFVCKFCSKRFGRKSNYNEHLRIHTGEAPYKCNVCNRTFKQHHGWKDHMRVHTGEKPYLCNLCGKRFTVGHNLNVHIRIHTGERPYTCDICKKSYRQKSAYNSHIKNVHGITK